MLRKQIILVVLISLIAGPLMAQKPEVTPLLSKELTDFPGKEGLWWRWRLWWPKW